MTLRCPICLGARDADGADDWSCVKACGHVLHTSCLATCLAQASVTQCPCCRTAVRVTRADPGHMRLFLENDDAEATSPGGAAGGTPAGLDQKLARSNAKLLEQLRDIQGRLMDAEEALRDADAARADAVDAAEAAAAVAVAAAEADLAKARDAEAKMRAERDRAFQEGHEAKRGREAALRAANKATTDVAALKRALARADLGAADAATLTDAQIVDLVGGACAGAEPGAVAAAAAKVKQAADETRRLRRLLHERDADLAAARAAAAAAREAAAAAAAAAAAGRGGRPASSSLAPDEIDYTLPPDPLYGDDNDENWVAPRQALAAARAAPAAAAAAAPPPPAAGLGVGAAALGSSVGLAPVSFVIKRPSAGGAAGARGTFIRDGADGKGGRAVALRPAGLGGVGAVAAARPPAKMRKTA